MSNGLNLPKRKSYCVLWFDEKGMSHLVSNSFRKTYKAAQKVADEYMFINQVQTLVAECLC